MAALTRRNASRAGSFEALPRARFLKPTANCLTGIEKFGALQPSIPTFILLAGYAHRAATDSLIICWMRPSGFK